MASIKFDIRGDNSNFLRSLQGAQSGVQRSIASIERAGSGMAGTFDKVKESALGGFKQIAMGMAGITALLESGGFLKGLIDEMGEFTKAMKEVSTLSKDVAQDLDLWKSKVVDLTTQIPIGATEAAKAMYQIESAGHHGADAMNVLEESAKGAIGGATETFTTADAITTILNSYSMSADQAAHVSDLLFTTVKLGKTTMGELGRSIAQVAPIASTYGVAIEDVLAAIATLTKSGTPTSIAIRQVRDSIVATTRSLGDGAFEGKRFIDAMAEVADNSNGSANALRDELKTLQAMNGVLGLTGKNAAGAAADLAEMQNSTGAAEEAYSKMADTAGNSAQLLKNNIFKALEPVGDEMIGFGKTISDALNAGFETGTTQKMIGALEALIMIYGIYRGLLMSVGAYHSLQTKGLVADYETQIAELERLMAVQEAKVEVDLQEAIDAGNLTEAHAILITQIKGELVEKKQQAMAYVETATAMAAEAETAVAMATAEKAAADEMMASAEKRLAVAEESDVQAEINAAKEEMNIAAMQQNTAAVNLNSATHARNMAVAKAENVSNIANAASKQIETQAELANASATGIAATAKMLAKKAQDAWNASMFASPIFWIAAVIAGVAYAIYKFVNAESEATMEVKEFNDTVGNASNKLRTLQQIINATDKGTSAYKKAINDLNSITKEYGITIDAETDSREELNRKIEETIRLKNEEANANALANGINSVNSKYEEKTGENYKKFTEDLDGEHADALSVTGKQFAENEEMLQQLADAWRDVQEAEEKYGKYNYMRAEEEKMYNTVRNQFIREYINRQKESMGLSEDEVRNLWTALMTYVDKQKDAKVHADATMQALYNESEAFARQSAEAALAEAGIEDFNKAQNRGSWYAQVLAQDVDKAALIMSSIINNFDGKEIKMWLSLDTSQIPAWAMDKTAADNLATMEYFRKKAASGQELTKEEKQSYGANMAAYNAKKNGVTIVGKAGGGKKPTTPSGKDKKKTPKKTGKTGPTKEEIDYDVDEINKAFTEALKDFQDDMDEDRTDLMQEVTMRGTELEIAKIKEETKRRKEAYREQFDELVKKRQEADKKIWLKQNHGKKEHEYKPTKSEEEYRKEVSKALGSESGDYLADVDDYLDKIEDRKVGDIQRGEAEKGKAAWIDYFKTYGTLAEKRKAAEDEFNLNKEKIDHDEEISAEERNAQLAANLKAYEQSLRDIDFEELKENINWEYIFGDLENVDTQTLEVVEGQLEEFIKNSKDLKPDELKTLTDALLKVQEAMDLSHPLTAIKEAREEYAAAKNEFDEYQKKLDKARKDGNKDDEKEALKGMTSASQKMQKAKNKEKTAFESVTGLVDDYAKALDEAGDVIGGAAGQCMKLAASAVSAGVGMANGIKAFGEAASAMEKSVAILAIIEAALKAVQLITQIFGDKADITLTNYVETIDVYINLLDDSISALNQSMSDTKNTIAETISYYEDLIKLQKDQAAAIKSQSEVWLNSGASKGFLGIGGSSSEGVKIVKQIKESLKSGNAEVRKFYTEGYNNLNEYFKKVHGYYASSADDFGRLAWLWNLSDEDLIALSKDTKALSLLGDELSGAIVKYAESLKEIKDAQLDEFEALLTVSYDDFYDDFVSMVSDMDNTSADFANNFAQYMRTALIKSLIAANYKDKIEALYRKAGEWASDEEGLTEARLDQLKKEYMEYAKSAQNDIDLIDKIVGTDAADQQASAKGFAAMSQDTAEELNARFTALQIAGESISEQVIYMVQYMASMVTMTTSRNQTLMEIRNLMFTSNGFLEDIAKYTKIASLFGEKIDKIVEQTKNL